MSGTCIIRLASCLHFNMQCSYCGTTKNCLCSDVYVIMELPGVIKLANERVLIDLGVILICKSRNVYVFDYGQYN